ncbi:MAG: hypothetical protein RMJ66_05355 [Bacteroidia bacterium]|nr:hypothetical protein [Bacteroidia bacterium]MDW8134475.1 hypothetical protein [Bacteroidia bacterium]
MRYWIWLFLLIDSGCRSEKPPSISTDTMAILIRKLYTYRTHLQLQNYSPQASESLLSAYTYHLLEKHKVQIADWESLRSYFAHNPAYWQAVLDSVLVKAP